MSPVTVATLKLLGGHPALDFTNTVNARGAVFGPDTLQAYGDLLDWAVRLGMLDADEARVLRALSGPEAKAALDRAKALREAIYRIFASRPAEIADLALLQDAVRAAQAARHLMPDGDGYAWRWAVADPDGITHQIALAAAELLTAPAVARVHVCPGPDCAWLFLDNSRSGRRLWCSEATCGVRSRVRRWRGRHNH